MINTLGAGAEVSSQRSTFLIWPTAPLSRGCFRTSNRVCIRVSAAVGGGGHRGRGAQVGVGDGYESEGRELSPNAGRAVREREECGTPSELQLPLISCRTLRITLYNTPVPAATVHLQVRRQPQLI